jgi:hyperosmotically inducible periplasmic protein
MRRVLLILILVVFASGVPVAQTVPLKQQQFEIEHELVRLPTYGVFDFIAFGYDKGKVTLEGYAYQGGLKAHATRAVRRVPGVDQVDNNIELLPDSPNDDRIRWATFYKIYTDGFLSRYSPGGEMAARYELYQSRRFPGMQPFGTYPIHIIVKNGRTTLMGVVDSQMDKQMAEFRAREVSGTFAVENELVVDSE